MEQGLKIARHRVGPHYYQLISTVPLSVCFFFLPPRKKACRMGSKGYQEKNSDRPPEEHNQKSGRKYSRHSETRTRLGFRALAGFFFFFSVCSISFSLDFLLLYNKPP